ncbi:MAG: response regulator transcription factor, partial [Blautia coccoides]
MADILIVEDERSINELMKRTLTMTGHKCCQVYTGREALRAAVNEKPDIVLLDINLPDMDGFQVMEQIGDVPVIYVTARDEVTDRVRGLNSGAEDYIVKPFAMEELVARVQVVLR